jgi:hypothetical protein
MTANKINLQFGIISAIILLGVISRLVPHLANFESIGGMALFGMAYYSKRYWAFIIPIAAMWRSDLVYTAVMFGAFKWSARQFPAFRLQKVG